MNKQGHTPGPWKVLDRLGYDGDHRHRYSIIQLGGTNEVIAKTVKEYDSVNDFANARLIAAAPKLLAACEQAKEALRQLCYHPAFAGDAPQFNEGGIGYEASQAIRAAISMTTA